MIDMCLVVGGRNATRVPFWPYQRLAGDIIQELPTVSRFIPSKNLLLLAPRERLATVYTWMVIQVSIGASSP